MNNVLTKISRRNVQAALEAPSQRLRFQREQTLYQYSDPAQFIFRVLDGLVRITRVTPEGRLLTVRHVMPGDFFGEGASIDGPREEIVEALTISQVKATEPKRINHHDLMTITQSSSKQMQHLMDYKYHLKTGNLRQRVARYLLGLSKTPLAVKNSDLELVILATHELIAEGTTSTRVSVSKTITEFRCEELIASGYRSVVLLQPEKLAEISQDSNTGF